MAGANSAHANQHFEGTFLLAPPPVRVKKAGLRRSFGGPKSTASKGRQAVWVWVTRGQKMRLQNGFTKC